MRVEELFQAQYELDKVVADNLGLTEKEFNSDECVEKRIMAAKIEFAELANEIGSFFKYWKQSHVMKRGETIEELSDGIHLLLSIGNSRKYNFIQEVHHEAWMQVPVIRLFTYLFKSEIDTFQDWLAAFEQLICIGIKLGFTEEEMVKAYHEKRLKNIARQAANY